MAKFKHPKQIQFVDDLPLTATMKIKKAELKEKYLSQTTDKSTQKEADTEGNMSGGTDLRANGASSTNGPGGSRHNRITEILGSSYPIIQGAMRMITLGEMAAAVSNCGGFGQIAASGLSNDKLRAELKRARELTDRPVGVNIPIYRPNAFDALEIAIEMGVKTITTSAGNPAKMMERIREAGLRVVHKVSNESMARKAQAAGVDAVVVTGFEAGGHIGRNDVSTLCMVPQIVDALDIPVVAAGGIGDARGLVAAFALGAEGVEMGTRFLATRECSVPSFFKERVCSASSDETFILGKKEMPIRVLRNKMTEQLEKMGEAEADEFLGKSGDSTYVTRGRKQGKRDHALRTERRGREEDRKPERGFRPADRRSRRAVQSDWGTSLEEGKDELGIHFARKEGRSGHDYAESPGKVQCLCRTSCGRRSSRSSMTSQGTGR